MINFQSSETTEKWFLLEENGLKIGGIPKIHPTQKPVALLEEIISLYTDIDDVVIDCCAGSGTTLLASANLGRRAYGFELKREYVKGFYEKLLPLAQENMFIQAEREEKKIQIQSLFGGNE